MRDGRRRRKKIGSSRSPSQSFPKPQVQKKVLTTLTYASPPLMPSSAINPATTHVAPASPIDAERKFVYASTVVNARRESCKRVGRGMRLRGRGGRRKIESDEREKNTKV